MVISRVLFSVEYVTVPPSLLNLFWYFFTHNFLFQVALNNGYGKGTRAAYVGIHRNQEDAHHELKTPVTAFKVEPGETWVLFPSVGTDIHHGKTKKKMFSKSHEKWVDKDGQDRDPHACLKKGRLSEIMSCTVGHLFF